LPQFVSPDDPAAAGKLVFLGVEFVVVAVPVVITIVLGAEWLTRALKTQPWVSKALNWCFGGVFLTFAATILLAEGRK
ncbi:MAG TPA: LysE family translocator, partial [Devosia sp.]|nr:LysE family translocator [Devosia sp.]